jgi:hypothetical protein
MVALTDVCGRDVPPDARSTHRRLSGGVPAPASSTRSPPKPKPTMLGPSAGGANGSCAPLAASNAHAPVVNVPLDPRRVPAAKSVSPDTASVVTGTLGAGFHPVNDTVARSRLARYRCGAPPSCVKAPPKNSRRPSVASALMASSLVSAHGSSAPELVENASAATPVPADAVPPATTMMSPRRNSARTSNGMFGVVAVARPVRRSMP